MRFYLDLTGDVSCILTDASFDEVKIGLPVEFTFRKSYGETLPEYIWKVRQPRISEGEGGRDGEH